MATTGLYGEQGSDMIAGEGGNDTILGGPGDHDVIRSDLIEAIDDQKDKVIDCGPSHDLRASVDQVDPRPQSC